MRAAARRVAVTSGHCSVVRAISRSVGLNMHTHLYIVQERLLEMLFRWWRIPRCYRDGHEHESLILAQNERWRHA